MDILWRSGDLSLLSKSCAVKAGYYEDDFIELFVPGEKQSPLVSILYYLRVQSVRETISRFLESFPDEQAQFVNFGCGADTIAFWVLQRYKNVTCYEVDFPDQLRKKASVIKNCKRIMELLRDPEISDGGLLFSSCYRMVPANLEFMHQVSKLSTDYGFSDSLPTLFLSECALTYIETEMADEVIRFSKESCKGPSCFVYWEHISMNDNYGKLMLKRFKDYGLEIHSANKYPTIRDQKSRYEKLGWDHVVVVNMSDVYNSVVSQEERQRILKLEFLDEIEEMVLLCTHYVIGVAATQHLKSVFSLFECEKIKRISYTTEQIRKMISSGTLSQMQPPVLNSEANSQFFNEAHKDVSQ